MSILRPIFGRGVAQRRLGAEVPEFRQKFPVLLGAPVVPKAQIWNSKNPGSPPLKKMKTQLLQTCRSSRSREEVHLNLIKL